MLKNGFPCYAETLSCLRSVPFLLENGCFLLPVWMLINSLLLSSHAGCPSLQLAVLSLAFIF